MSLPTPAWICIAVIALWLLGRIQNRGSNALFAPKMESVGGFANVAGCEEAVYELREMSKFITDPERFLRMGARTPKGAVLVGPPGTGKTLLARALAEETGVAFIHANGSDFVEMYVGVGATRIRDLYKRAREAKRAIVFIDEIDALARSRATDKSDVASGSQTEHENTLIALLTELDGFEQHPGIVTIAATNRPDILDPAVCRPGRLERRIHVPAPDRAGRAAILRVHTRNKPLEDDVSIDDLSSLTSGMTGADLERVANEAAIAAASRYADAISMRDMIEAVEYVAMGRPSRSRIVTTRDRRITAWHEAGHAVVGLLLVHARPPLAVSVIPRGAAGGVTWFSASDDQYVSVEEAKDHLAVMLAGRAAEELLMGGSFTHGAASDLEKATEFSKNMVGRFGMYPGHLQTRRTSDDATSEAVDSLIQEARERALDTLEQNRALLEQVATSLQDRDTLTASDLTVIASGGTLPRVEQPHRDPEVPEHSLNPAKSGLSGVKPHRKRFSVLNGLSKRRRA